MYDQNPVIRTVKTMLTSPLFLVGAISYSVYGLFELMSGMLGGSDLVRMLNRLMTVSGGYDIGYDYISPYINAVSGIRVVSALIGAIPVILIAVGMWMLFAAAKSNTQQGMNVTGLTMIRIVAIVQLVFTCLGVVLAELLCIFVMIGANAAMSYIDVGFSAGPVIAGIMIGLVASSALGIFYYVKLIRLIKSMKNVMTSGVPDSGVSLYVEIFCYAAGGIAGISCLSSLAGMSVYGFLANAGLAAANITFAIFLRKYRGNMQMLVMNGGQTGNMPGQPEDSLYRQADRMGNQPQYQQPSALQQQSYQQQPGQMQEGYLCQQPQQGMQQPQQGMQQQFQQGVRQPYQNQQSYGQESETTVLPYYNETSVLSGQLVNNGQTQLVRLTRRRTGETLCISKPSFWIGKDPASVDYCITDNTAVSRRHALVTIQNGNCYIRDNRSTNKVFVNGQMIQPEVDTLLVDGDRVGMGDEEFVVSIS